MCPLPLSVHLAVISPSIPTGPRSGPLLVFTPTCPPKVNSTLSLALQRCESSREKVNVKVERRVFFSATDKSQVILELECCFGGHVAAREGEDTSQRQGMRSRLAGDGGHVTARIRSRRSEDKVTSQRG
eukprot:3698757-Rhodomonas_salina.1